MSPNLKSQYPEAGGLQAVLLLAGKKNLPR
jgi:hypothetical protein